MHQSGRITALDDVLRFLDTTSLGATRKRDMVSAVKRISEMAGTTPAGVAAEAPLLRGLLSRIRPAGHGITAKSFSNLKSLLSSALQLCGVLDPLGRGGAKRNPVWGPLLVAVADDKRLSNGLAAFANWCAAQGISPTPGGRRGRPAISGLARDHNASPQATRSGAPGPQCVERSRHEDRYVANREARHPLL